MTFEDFLKEVHSCGYRGLDDGMSDNYEYWITELDCDDWIALGERYATEKLGKTLEEATRLATNTTVRPITEPKPEA